MDVYLLPAIDILGGEAVRLAKGDYQQVTVYNEDPAAQAQDFAAAGAHWIHVVDLDGAKSGTPQNYQIVERILARTNLSIEVGGGVRSISTIDRLLHAGASRVVLGTALVRDPEFAKKAVKKFGPDVLVAGIDARDGEVAISGWVEGSGVNATELARLARDFGYEHLIYTDISRDGLRVGVNTQDYIAMAIAFGHPVIASGGVASVEDIKTLAQCASSIEGVIAGRALYEGSLTVEEGVEACASVS